MKNRIRFLNTFIDDISMNDAVAYIEKCIMEKLKIYIIPVNVDVIMQIERDAYLQRITNNAELIFADGKPLLWISKWLKHPIREKVSGSDLVPELCKLASQKSFTIYILGGKEGVAEQAKRNLERDMPGIKIVGTYSPPLGFEKDPSEISKINEKISKEHPDLLFVCFGCPKQEKFVYKNYLNYDAAVSICAGATVDFLAGNKKRAPRWMSEHGLEWIYRFVLEPKRLFKRYFEDDVKILGLVRKYR